MTQLILDIGGGSVTLPESKKGGYDAHEESLSVSVEMISGRLVREVRGMVWRVKYQYGYFDDETKNKVLAACRKGQQEPISCAFLPPDGAGLKSASFVVTAFTAPRFQWSRPVAGTDGAETAAPVWADFAVELREVRPHD